MEWIAVITPQTKVEWAKYVRKKQKNKMYCICNCFKLHIMNTEKALRKTE